MDSYFNTRSIQLSVAVISLGSIMLYMKSRKKRFDRKDSSEKFITPSTGSWFSLILPRDDESNESSDNNHPEGPNIGYGSNNSWLGSEKGTKSSAKTDLLHTGHIKGGKLLVVMVGLPGRGKTYIARKVARYLRWISYRTRAISLAKYRLDRVGSKAAEFFDQSSSSYAQRLRLLNEAVDDSIKYLNRGGEIVILDGTNSTRERRQLIRDRVAKEDGYDILWIESVSNHVDLTEKQLEDLRNSPDFIDKNDYELRMLHYQKNYEQLEDDEGSFIRVYGDGRTLTLHEIHGFLRTKIVSFMMNLHTEPRPIYITRHGESDFNIRGLIGGDSGLSTRGVQFAKALGEFMLTEELPKQDASVLSVWSSTMRRARETAKEIPSKRYVEWRSLREIEVGVCDGLSYEQVKVRFPEEYRSRLQDKLKYRYPRGESYLDVINRLEPVIFELERQREPILIVAHQAVIRCLYAYFLDLPAEEIPFLSIPLHTLIRLKTQAYGCNEKRMKIVMQGEYITNDGQT